MRQKSSVARRGALASVLACACLVACSSSSPAEIHDWTKLVVPSVSGSTVSQSGGSGDGTILTSSTKAGHYTNISVTCAGNGTLRFVNPATGALAGRVQCFAASSPSQTAQYEFQALPAARLLIKASPASLIWRVNIGVS